MTFYAELWFWLFIVGIILFAIGAAFFDYDRNKSGNDTPWWIWAVLILGMLFLIVGLIVYVLMEPSNLEKCCGSWRLEKVNP